MPALKIEQIYEKIYSIESILNSAVKESDSGLSLDNMKEFALNLGALQMVNMLPHMDLIPVETQNRINLLMGEAQRKLTK